MKISKKTPLETDRPTNFSRRNFMRIGFGLGASIIGGSALANQKSNLLELPFANGQRRLVVYPQKRPLMLLTSRPIQLETPFAIFNDNIFTPNDAFFVRWHLANVPAYIDTSTFKIRLHGRVKSEFSISLQELKNSFEPVEIAAVCQCAGNSRGFFEPRINGGQWGNGAMGNARWKGVRLRDLFNKANLEGDATRVRFNGQDTPVSSNTPDFLKSIDLDVALSDDVLVAYEMNGAPLPLLNGFPVRLVLPGWYATYWVKMLNDIEILNKHDENFWTKSTYRIPDNPCACVEAGAKMDKSLPINRLTIRSFITSIQNDAVIKAGYTSLIKGIAFDAGHGIQRVLFSSDGGQQWNEATLGQDYGKYSFREWTINFTPANKQPYALLSMAVNSIGETQPIVANWNPSGYLRNVIEPLRVNAI